MTNPTVKIIISPEQVFQFLKDDQEQRRQEIRLEDAIRRLSMESSVLNLN